MRISFLAVLAVALLVGLGVVVAVKSLGLLSTPATAVLQPVPRQEVLVAPMVLVAQRPLFPNDPILPGDLGARNMSKEEYDVYNKLDQSKKDDYLMPIPQAAYYRFVKGAIPANRPLLKTDLEEIHKPDPINERLLPGSRAVNLTVNKTLSAGALIQNGDWVDVSLTTNVRRTDSSELVQRTAVIVRNAHVIARRDTLFNVYTPLRSDEVPFTLAMNPYRAELLNYARTLGSISLTPVSHLERERLDAIAKEVRQDPAKADRILLGETGTKEAQEEALRVKEYFTQGVAISWEDMAQAMQLKPLAPPAPVYIPPPTRVEVIRGIGKSDVLSFAPPASLVKLPPPLAPEYRFSNPDDKIKFVPPGPALQSGNSGTAKTNIQMIPTPGGVKLP